MVRVIYLHELRCGVEVGEGRALPLLQPVVRGVLVVLLLHDVERVRGPPVAGVVVRTPVHHVTVENNAGT